MATRIDRKRVVDTALRLLNEVGLEGLTLRRIAGELDVKAPALYWHFDSKQALLDEMATEMLRRMNEGPPPRTDDWRQWIVEVNQELRRALLSYRDGAKVFSGTTLTDTSHRASMDERMRVFVDAGFTAEQTAQAFFTAYSFTIGFVIEEQAVYPVPGERDPRYDTEALVEKGMADGYPLYAATREVIFSGFDERFETGLRVIVAGIEQYLLSRR